MSKNKFIDLLRLSDFKENIINLIPKRVSQLENDSKYATQGDVDTLKKSVSDGKAEVANAITEKGVTTAADATFPTITDNIRKLKTTFRTQSKSVTPTDYVQTIYPDSTFDGLYAVSVGAAPYAAPTGSVTFTIKTVNDTPIYIIAYKKPLTITYSLAKDTYVRITGNKINQLSYMLKSSEIILRNNTNNLSTPLNVEAGYDLIMFNYLAGNVVDLTITITYQ